MKATFVVLALLAVTAQSAMAASSDNPLDTRIYKNGLWVGGGLNWTSVDPDSGGVDDDDAFGGNVGVGYQFMNYFGVNARYKWLGDYDFGGPGNVGDNADLYGWTVGANAGYPITGRIGVVGGLGYYDFNLDGVGGDSGEDGLYLSGGIVSQIGRIVVQPEIVWYDTSDADVIGLEVNFFWKTEIGN